MGTANTHTYIQVALSPREAEVIVDALNRLDLDPDWSWTPANEYNRRVQDRARKKIREACAHRVEQIENRRTARRDRRRTRAA